VAHYTFKHRLIQDVAYESILETRRAELHREVGHVIEQHLQGAPGYHGMLAYHYSMGNDVERAEEELFLAGDDAARAGAPAEALELLEESSRLYLARHPGGGDPTKRVALHKRLAGAYLHRGLMGDACRNYDEALSLLGEVVPATRLAVGLSLARTLTLVGLDLYLTGGGSARRAAASPRDLEIIDLMFNRARAQTTADPARFVLNGLETLRKLRGSNPATVPGAASIYAGMVGLFSFGGISFDVGRRFLAVAERYIEPYPGPESFFWRVMTFTHTFLAGDWDDRHEIPAALVEEALRRGQLWDAVTHVGLEGFKQLAQGRWAECNAHVDWLERVEETYAYDYARSNRHASLAFLHTERRALADAEAAADVYLTSNDEVLLNLLALGTKAKVQVLRGDFPGAHATLDIADKLLEQRVPPWYGGVVSRSHLLLEASEREAGVHRPDARRSRRMRRLALASVTRFAWLRPEVWCAVGRLAWLAGRHGAARRWYARALAEAERLRMRPEAARIRLEVARRLLAAGAAASFGGRDAATLLREARGELEALELIWDLAHADEVASRVQGRALAAELR
jgi:tetratricopeptide (TPR) repeat protein